MITVNGKSFDLEKNVTVLKLLEMLESDPVLGSIRSTHQPCVVILQGRVLMPGEYGQTLVEEGNDLKVLPRLAGG